MSIEQAIIRTVAYFDIFDYPLTDFEIWQYLPMKFSLEEVRAALTAGSLPLESSLSFYFLPGRAEIEKVRRQRYTIADEKIKKTRRRLRLISWLPGTRLICLANVIGSHNLRAGGDSDLFIITAQNRLWLFKTLASIILKLGDLRPRQGKIADQLCLSFLVEETSLDLSPFRLENDDYLTYWLAGLIPLYGSHKAYQELVTNNPWITDKLPNWSKASTTRLRFKAKETTPNSPSPLSFLNIKARALHLRVMSPEIRQAANRDNRVVVSHTVLKLHTSDRRQFFQEELTKRLRLLGV